MKNDLKDILANNNRDIDNQQLMDYLNSQLSDTAAHDIEKNMAADEFLNDAIEGLQEIKDKKNMQAYVEQLNNMLQKQTAKNKKKKEKRKLKDNPYIYITLIIILLLLITSFFVIRKYIEK